MSIRFLFFLSIFINFSKSIIIYRELSPPPGKNIIFRIAEPPQKKRMLLVFVGSVMIVMHLITNKTATTCEVDI